MSEFKKNRYFDCSVFKDAELNDVAETIDLLVNTSANQNMYIEYLTLLYGAKYNAFAKTCNAIPFPTKIKNKESFLSYFKIFNYYAAIEVFLLELAQNNKVARIKKTIDMQSLTDVGNLLVNLYNKNSTMISYYSLSDFDVVQQNCWIYLFNANYINGQNTASHAKDYKEYFSVAKRKSYYPRKHPGCVLLTADFDAIFSKHNKSLANFVNSSHLVWSVINLVVIFGLVIALTQLLPDFSNFFYLALLLINPFVLKITKRQKIIVSIIYLLVSSFIVYWDWQLSSGGYYVPPPIDGGLYHIINLLPLYIANYAFIPFTLIVGVAHVLMNYYLTINNKLFKAIAGIILSVIGIFISLSFNNFPLLMLTGCLLSASFVVINKGHIRKLPFIITSILCLLFILLFHYSVNILSLFGPYQIPVIFFLILTLNILIQDYRYKKKLSATWKSVGIALIYAVVIFVVINYGLDFINNLLGEL